MSFKEWVKNKERLIYIIDKTREFYYKNLISDKKLVRKKFKKILGREVNLQDPIKYNDKLQWLKLYWHDPLAAKCADKYAVRDYVANTIGSKYLNKLIAVYDSIEDINLNELPQSFVLKGTHGSGFNIICEDKDQVDWNSQFKKMKRWLWTNYYWSNREWVYKRIKPRIVCERYLEENQTGQLKDYKFHCFNGEPKIVQVDFDRFNGHKKNLYDLNWNMIDVCFNYPNDKSIEIKKPRRLNEMIKLSRLLSNRFPYSRIDFYAPEGEIIFGEITFFPASGMGEFKPGEFDNIMGEWLELPQVSK